MQLFVHAFVLDLPQESRAFAISQLPSTFLFRSPAVTLRTFLDLPGNAINQDMQYPIIPGPGPPVFPGRCAPELSDIAYPV